MAVSSKKRSERRLLGNCKQLGKHYFSYAKYAFNLFCFRLTKIGIDGLLFEFVPCMTLLCNQWRKENSTVFDKLSHKQKVWFSHLFFFFSFWANRTERSKIFFKTVICSVIKGYQCGNFCASRRISHKESLSHAHFHVRCSTPVEMY